ncbi:MAG: hypothetical protein NHG36_20180 [Chromatiaceae bacterium]|nr:hypothetical protein [Candidatus Thioaporhodococcus sediminis]
MKSCRDCRHYRDNGFCMAPVPVWVIVQLSEAGQNRADDVPIDPASAGNCDAYFAPPPRWVPPTRGPS